MYGICVLVQVALLAGILYNPKGNQRRWRKMDQKTKMLELIKKKQGGGRSKQMAEPKNDRKNMRKGPKIYNK